MDCKTALLTLLDQVDYTAGNCRLNDMVGAVLPVEIIRLCREAIQSNKSCEHEWIPVGEQVIEYAEFCPICRSIHGQVEKEG